MRLPFNSALFSVANCFRLAYLRYTLVTLVSSIAFTRTSSTLSSSHLLRERIAQAVEQKVREQKQQPRSDGQRQQPLPVAEIAVEIQDLLVRNREVGKRVQVQIRLNRRGGKPPVIDDGRGKEPQRHDVREDVLDVAEMDRQRRQDQGQGDAEQQLHQDDERKPHELGRVERPAEIDQKREE